MLAFYLHIIWSVGILGLLVMFKVWFCNFVSAFPYSFEGMWRDLNLNNHL